MLLYVITIFILFVIFCRVAAGCLVASRSKAALKSSFRRFFVILPRRHDMREASSSSSFSGINASDALEAEFSNDSFNRLDQSLSIKVEDLCGEDEPLNIALNDVDDAPLTNAELYYIEANMKDSFKCQLNEYFIQRKGCELKNCRKLINRLLQMQ